MCKFSLTKNLKFVKYMMLNTLRLRQNDTISQMTFWNAFSWMKMFEFRLGFHWSLFPMVQLTNMHVPAMVQIMAWGRPGDKPLSRPMMVCLLMHIYVTLPQWVNALVSEPHYHFEMYHFEMFVHSQVSSHGDCMKATWNVVKHSSIFHCLSGKLWYLQHIVLEIP